MLNIINHSEMQIKTTHTLGCLPSKRKKKQKIRVDEDAEKLEHLYAAGGDVK